MYLQPWQLSHGRKVICLPALTTWSIALSPVSWNFLCSILAADWYSGYCIVWRCRICDLLTVKKMWVHCSENPGTFGKRFRKRWLRNSLLSRAMPIWRVLFLSCARFSPPQARTNQFLLYTDFFKLNVRLFHDLHLYCIPTQFCADFGMWQAGRFAICW